MLKRITIAVLSAGLATLGIGFAVMQSETGSQSLCNLAIAILEDATAQPVTVSRCILDPLGGEIVVEDARVGTLEQPILLAERLTLSISLRSRLRIDAVEVLRPRISLDLSSLAERSSEPVEKERPNRTPSRTSTSCLPDLRLIELGKISLVDGQVQVRLADHSLIDAEDINVSLGETKRLIDFALKVGPSSYRKDENALGLDRAVLEGQVNLREGSVQIQGLDVAAPEGSVFGQAELTSLCGLRGNATLTTRLNLQELGSSILPVVPGLGGAADARIRARFDLFHLSEPFELNAELNLQDSRVLSLRPGNVSTTVKLLPGKLHVEHLELPLDTGKVQAKGTIALKRPFELDASATLHNTSLGEFLYRLGVDTLPVHLVATGNATARGPLWGASGMRLSGNIDAQVRDFGVHANTWQRRHDGSRYVGLAQGHVVGTVEVGHRDLVIKEARITSPGSSIHTKGRIEYTRGMELDVRGSKVDLDELGPYASARIGGIGTVVGTVKGPWRGLDIRGDASVESGWVQKLNLGEASASVHLDLDTGSLKVSDAFGRKGKAIWSGDAHLELFGGARIEESRMVFEPSSLVDLALIAENYAPSLKIMERHVSGRFQGEARAHGPVRAIDASAFLEISELNVAGQSLGSGNAVVTMRDTNIVQINELALNVGNAELYGTGTMSINTLRHNALVEISGLDVRHIDRLASVEELEGTVNLRLDSRGRLSSPRATGELVLRDWFWQERPLWTARLDMALARGLADLHGSVYSPWPKGVPRPELEPDSPEPLPPGSMIHTLQGAIQLGGNLPFALDLDLNLPDARALLIPGEFGELEGSLGGELHARGELLNPMQTEALLELDRLWGRIGRWNVRNTAPVLAVLEHGRLSLQELPIGGPGFNLEAFGVREADGELDLTLRGSAELGILRELIEGLDEAQGQLDLDVAIGGTTSDPSIVGYARLENGRLRPSGALFALENTQGLLTFSPEALMIDGLEGELNGGPVELSGSVELDNFIPQRVELRLAMGEIPLRLEGIPVVIAGSPTISGTPDHMLLGGELEVVRFRFHRDIELERVLIQAIELARRPPAPKVFERSGEFLSLDMAIRLGDVRVENNLLHSDLRGDLRLTGTNRRPGLLGTVTLVGGTAWVRNTEFDVTSGVVNFTDRTRIRPTFDLRTEALVRDYNLSVVASGSPQQPRILLSSEPPLPEADIVTLLTLGITARDFDDPRAGSSSIGGFLVDAAYNASGLNRQVQSLLPQTEILRDATFRLTSAYSEVSGNIEPIAQFETKFLTDDLRLRAQTSLLGNRGRRAQAEYRLDDGISAQIQWDSDNPNAPSIGDIGGDLKLHWELP